LASTQLQETPDKDVLGYLVGGWSVGATWAIQSGQPFTISTGVDSNGDGDTANDRPDINPDGDPTTVGGYVQRGSLIGGNGNLGRNTGRGPRLNNVNATLFKNFRVYREQQLQIRGELFNLLNHRQFVLRNDGRERNLWNPAAQFYDLLVVERRIADGRGGAEVHVLTSGPSFHDAAHVRYPGREPLFVDDLPPTAP
jgi:hypothetical protein